MTDRQGAQLFKIVRAKLAERRLSFVDQKVDDMPGSFLAQRAEAP